MPTERLDFYRGQNPRWLLCHPVQYEITKKWGCDDYPAEKMSPATAQYSHTECSKVPNFQLADLCSILTVAKMVELGNNINFL